MTAPILSGHEVTGPNQIVLGAETMQQLHKHLGQTVTATYGTKKDYPVYVPPTKMTIVGTATLPAIGGTLIAHTSMGVGAIDPVQHRTAAFQKFLHNKNETLDGYSDIFVRFEARCTDRRSRSRRCRKIAQIGQKEIQATPDGGGSDVAVQSVLYPAEIENYRAIGVIPDLLALALALGAVVALGLTLDRLGESSTARPRAPSHAGIHESTAPVGGRVAGLGRGRRRRDLRHPPRHPRGSLALDALRQQHLRRAAPDRCRSLPLVIVALSAVVLANVVAALARAKRGANLSGTGAARRVTQRCRLGELRRAAPSTSRPRRRA